MSFRSNQSVVQEEPRSLKTINRQGREFRLLTVESFAGYIYCVSGQRQAVWWCICKCGSRKAIRWGDLTSGKTVSCGCHIRSITRLRNTDHGKALRGKRSKEYRAWCAMINRCYNPNSQDFQYYGGRGIQVCAAWYASFSAFLKDVGYAPTAAHTLDRFPDNNDHYAPGNVRWATRKQQANNRRPRGH